MTRRTKLTMCRDRVPLSFNEWLRTSKSLYSKEIATHCAIQAWSCTWHGYEVSERCERKRVSHPLAQFRSLKHSSPLERVRWQNLAGPQSHEIVICTCPDWDIVSSEGEKLSARMTEYYQLEIWSWNIMPWQSRRTPHRQHGNRSNSKNIAKQYIPPTAPTLKDCYSLHMCLSHCSIQLHQRILHQNTSQWLKTVRFWMEPRNTQWAWRPFPQCLWSFKACLR